MKKPLLFLFTLFWACQAFAQPKPVSAADTAKPIKVWDKTFGSDKNDLLSALIPTGDGNFLLAGYSEAGVSGEKTQASNGASDYWIVKIDNEGRKIWDRSFGGVLFDEPGDVVALKNGEFLLGGTSYSEPSGDKTSVKTGSGDFWVIKLDANGNKIWDKGYGGNESDDLKCLLADNDGGFLLGGNSDSGISGDKTHPSLGENDFWLVKTDADGSKIWDKTFGGNLNDELTAMVATDDGGYLLGGHSNSDISGNFTENSHGDSDFWLIKIDAKGNEIWNKRYGGERNDAIYELIKTADGGYLLGGTSESDTSAYKTENALGELDYWLVKIDANGQKQWDRSFGGNASDGLATMLQDTDGGYLLGGYSASGISAHKTTPPSGYADFWLIKTAANGTLLWEKQLGGNDYDTLFAIQKTNDGGYVLGGHSASGISGDKTENPKGSNDFWIVKIK